MDFATILLIVTIYLIVGGGVIVIFYEEDLPPKTKYMYMLNLIRYFFFWPFSLTIEMTKSFYRYWTNLPDE
jgi:hypothetical protein